MLADLVVAGCGIVGMVCFCLVFAPQAWLNEKRKTTTGLSMATMFVWQSAGMTYAAFLLYESASAWVVFSVVSFMGVAAVIDAQIAVYTKGWRVPVALLSAAIMVATVAVVGILWFAYDWLPDPVAVTLGDLLPAALFTVGFFPQFQVFIETWSVEGYSFGVTALDLVGSVANALVLFLTQGWGGRVWLSALPFLAIAVLHVVLILLALVIIDPCGMSPRRYIGFDDKGVAVESGSADDLTKQVTPEAEAGAASPSAAGAADDAAESLAAEASASSATAAPAVDV